MRSSCHSSYPTLLYVFFFSFLSLITETLPQCDITRGDTMTGHATSRLQDNWVVSVRPPASQSIAVPSFTSNFIFFSLIVYLCVFLLSSFFKKELNFLCHFSPFFFTDYSFTSLLAHSLLSVDIFSGLAAISYLVPFFSPSHRKFLRRHNDASWW